MPNTNCSAVVFVVVGGDDGDDDDDDDDETLVPENRSWRYARSAGMKKTNENKQKNTTKLSNRNVKCL